MTSAGGRDARSRAQLRADITSLVARCFRSLFPIVTWRTGGPQYGDGRQSSRSAGRTRAAPAFDKTDSRSAGRLWTWRSGQFKSVWTPSRHVARSCSRSRHICAPLSGMRRRRICSYSRENGTGRRSYGRGPRQSAAHTPMPCDDAWGCVLSGTAALTGRPPPSGSLPGRVSDPFELSRLGSRTPSICIAPSDRATSASRG
jgi:hypothetical protein